MTNIQEIAEIAPHRIQFFASAENAQACVQQLLSSEPLLWQFIDPEDLKTIPGPKVHPPTIEAFRSVHDAIVKETQTN